MQLGDQEGVLLDARALRDPVEGQLVAVDAQHGGDLVGGDLGAGAGEGLDLLGVHLARVHLDQVRGVGPIQEGVA